MGDEHGVAGADALGEYAVLGAADLGVERARAGAGARDPGEGGGSRGRERQPAMRDRRVQHAGAVHQGEHDRRVAGLAGEAAKQGLVGRGKAGSGRRDVAPGGGPMLVGCERRGERTQRPVDVASEVVADEHVGQRRCEGDGDGDGDGRSECDATLEAHWERNM